MDEGRKRVIGIMASILASLDMQTADDLYGLQREAHGWINWLLYRLAWLSK